MLHYDQVNGVITLLLLVYVTRLRWARKRCEVVRCGVEKCTAIINRQLKDRGTGIS